jgi:maltose alpha-D-glucosyltransferase / alpha-amylase
MHLALSGPTENEAFAPEPFTAADFAADAHHIEEQIKANLDALKRSLPMLDDAISDAAGLLLSRRLALVARARAIAALPPAGQRIRIHGDLHLGQALRRGGENDAGDFVFLDFEGEPARPLQERRRKQSPLKDVAGILRSFSYAAYAALRNSTSGSIIYDQSAEDSRLEGWAKAWQKVASREFISAYRDTVAANRLLLPAPEIAQTLLEGYLLEKALYELLYELNHRPEWLPIPISGILSL